MELMLKALPTTSGHKIFINPMHIVALRPADVADTSLIHLTSGLVFVIDKSMDAILEDLAEAMKTMNTLGPASVELI